MEIPETIEGIYQKILTESSGPKCLHHLPSYASIEEKNKRMQILHMAFISASRSMVYNTTNQELKPLQDYDAQSDEIEEKVADQASQWITANKFPPSLQATAVARFYVMSLMFWLHERYYFPGK